MAEEVTPSTASAEDAPASAVPAMATAPAKEGDNGDPAARKADVAAEKKPPPRPSSDDHYSRGRKRAEENFERQLTERFGVASLEELADRLALRDREATDATAPPDEDGGKPTLPDVRKLRTEVRKLSEEHSTLTTRYERQSKELSFGRERVKHEALRAALAQAGALYPDDEAQILASRVGLSSKWEPEEIDDKGAPTGRTVADVVAARREQRPELYRGESREGTGSRPARSIPQPTNGSGRPTADATTAAGIAERLQARGIR